MHRCLMMMCPDCQPGRAARALVFGDGAGENLFYALAPFAVLLVMLAIVSLYLDRADVEAWEGDES